MQTRLFASEIQTFIDLPGGPLAVDLYMAQLQRLFLLLHQLNRFRVRIYS